ncbi:MAG: hypothetical protein IT581_06645 [Verrucomicrobiales bacterium]|nr:hypothetical protein [Verrucomicrobiales bacterium]
MNRDAAMKRLIGWLGITPAIVFCGVILFGAALKIRRPAQLLSEWVMTHSWSGAVYLVTVLGGLVWVLIRAVSADQDSSVESCDRRRLGWVAFGLLLVTVPLMLFQILFIFAEED